MLQALLPAHQWDYARIRSPGFDTGLSTATIAGMRTNSARYPAAEQVRAAGGERLLTLLRRSLCAGVAAAGDVSTNAQSEQ